MIRIALLLWVVLAGEANAAAILVKSGEHDGFTRLVMDYGTAMDWVVGRTDDGYELRVAKPAPDYDLSEAFKSIGKSRLAGISMDPVTGNLHFSIACKCYAIPFEFRPGIVVIDLRNGAPPKGSSFELPLDPPSAPATDAVQAAKVDAPVASPEAAPSAGTYDWTQAALVQMKGEAPEATSALSLAPMPSSDPSLQILRESLLHQMSRGVAEGVVDMAKLKKSEKPQDPVPGDAFESARIGLGELPGVDVSNGLPTHESLGAQGQGCIEPDRLDIANWGSEKPVSEQLADTASGLIGEFDKPVPEALQRAIRYNLSIGFGAEARQLMLAFPTDLPDVDIWQSLAKLVDDRSDPNSAFVGQESCDSPAALWAILAREDLQSGTPVNTDAAYLALSALPIDLRRSIGPRLADRFMAAGNPDAAKKVRDAILRAPGGAGPQVSLLDARIDMFDGQPAKAEASLQGMIDDSGPETPAAMVALVKARVAQDLPVNPDMVEALQAIAQEKRGTADESATETALLLAKAASGDMDGAFAMLRDFPEVEPKLWRLLSLLGDDVAVLNHAVLAPNTPPANADTATKQKLAERLLALGMAENALNWVAEASQPDPVLLAQIQLQRRDGAAALRALTGLDSPEAVVMRAQALQLLGDDVAAAQVYAQAGDSTAEMRALNTARKWDEVSARGPDVWKKVADQVAPPIAEAQKVPTLPTGPLATGKALVENSVATRAAIDALLAQVAKP